jgi:hypothetical protein
LQRGLNKQNGHVLNDQPAACAMGSYGWLAIVIEVNCSLVLSTKSSTISITPGNGSGIVVLNNFVRVGLVAPVASLSRSTFHDQLSPLVLLLSEST